MPLLYTGEQLIRDIRNLTGVGNTNSDGGTDEDILLHINAAVKETILPFLHNSREDYLVVRERLLTDATGRVRLPERALWQKLSNLYWIDASLRKYLRPMPPEYQYENELVMGSVPEGYWIEGYDVVLSPISTGPVTLELAYFFRPGDLVKSTAGRRVTAVDTVTGVVTLSGPLPTSWSAAPLFEAHSSHSGAEIKAWDLAPSVVGGSTITFTPADIDGSTFGRKPLAAGDWMVLDGEAVLPGIPREWQPLIVRAVALRYAEAQGDGDATQIHAGLFEIAMKTAKATAEQRVELKNPRISTRRSTLAAARRRRLFR